MLKEWKEKTVRIDEIEVSMKLQMRAQEPPSEEYEEILRKKRSEWPFPRVRCVLVKDGDAETLFLVEGFTRLRAASDANRAKVPIEYAEGTWQDAVGEACASNADHGFRRTAADKRRAIIRAYEDVSESPTKIAKTCNVARATVYTVIEELKDAPAEQEGKKGAKPGKSPSTSASPDPVRPEPDSEIKTPCPVCGNVRWEPSDAGYTCAVCQQDYGEVAAVEEEEREEQASRRELIDEGVARDLATAKSDYGRLLRSLSRAGLADATERPMLAIHKKIEAAIRSQQR